MKRLVLAVITSGLAVSAGAADLADLAVNARALKALQPLETVKLPPAPLRPDLSRAGAPARPIEWITISGGEFMMGASDENGAENAQPAHEVAIETFEISKTLVTVEQYAECVINGGCTEPATGEFCNWAQFGRQLHPINCITWEQADYYAKFHNSRLPTEAEWEYAAKSGGRDESYPWGNDSASCDKAVMKGCGQPGTMPVCSKPAGNSGQGLCDMAGNVWEWVQDKYQASYEGASEYGAAFEDEGEGRVIRGGGFDSVDPELRADNRYFSAQDARNANVGFRLVKVGEAGNTAGHHL